MYFYARCISLIFCVYLSRFDVSSPTASLAFSILRAANRSLVGGPVGSSKSLHLAHCGLCTKQYIAVVAFLNSTVRFNSLQYFNSSLLTFSAAPHIDSYCPACSFYQSN